MLSRVLVSLAGVVASVGLLLYGMGSSYNPQDDGLKSTGSIMMVVGLVALAIGIVWYRKVEEEEVRRVDAEVRRRTSQ